jgi:hypothetical protein
MKPKLDQLQAALRKVQGDFGRTPGVTRIRLMALHGHPIILVEGTLAVRPMNLPRAYRVLVDAAPYMVPIAWRSTGAKQAAVPLQPSGSEADMPLNNDLWAGAPLVTPRPVKMWQPASTPLVPDLQQPPIATESEYQRAFSMRLPQFATPNFWAKPFYEGGNICCPFYETRTLAFSYQVPSDYLLIVTGVSYEFSDLVPFDQFTISVARDSNEVSRWVDMRALNTSDPAEEYVFAGHYRPFPYWGRFDHDQWLNIYVTVHGPWPFTATPQDQLGGCMSVFPSGWLGSLYDNRDGGARPVDMGELNDIALGTPSDDPVAPAEGTAPASQLQRDLRYARPGPWRPAP